MIKRLMLSAFLACFLIPQAHAHFGMVIPSQQMVNTQEDADLTVDLKFWHPFENTGMDLVRPRGFSVYVNGKEESLMNSLKEEKSTGKTAWQASYKATRPGLHTFVMIPEPYWEETEDCYIQHITKSVVAAYGQENGWDEPLGLAAEIVPLSKPYGLYAGNVFQGRVLFQGKPVPDAEVEIEWYPGPGLVGEAYSDMMVTQTIKADAAGVFTYAAPVSGWWGFAALMEGPEKMEYKNEKKDLEIGAVIWVRFLDWKKPVPVKK